MHRSARARTVPLVGTAAIGGAVVVEGYEIGPALGLHAAYGLTDAYDLRLELQGSQNDFGKLPVSFYGARLGLAYKIDVMRWIPYVGLAAGGFAIAWDTGRVFRPSVGGYFGLDYGFSDHFGLGVLGSADLVIANPAVTVSSLLFRAEYRVDL
jgi:hypothetical protein